MSEKEDAKSSGEEHIDPMDKLLALEDERNAKYRKRMLYLIPFNFLALWGTIKYF